MAYGNIPYISLPQINTQGPDVMGTMATLENIKASRQRQGLAEISAQREQERFDWQKKKYEEDRPLEKQSKILDMLHKTASVAVLAKNQEGANKIWEQGINSIKAVDPKFEIGEVPIQFKGDKVKQKLEDGSSIEGDQEEVFKFLQFRRAQKEKGVDINAPGMRDQFSELATSLRLSLEAPDETKSKTEEQLTARAMKGDKEAQAILDQMQKRKIDVARETASAREGEKTRDIEPWVDPKNPNAPVVHVRKGDSPPAGYIKSGVQSQGYTSPDSFPNWTDDQKEMAFKDKLLTGKDPRFNYRDRESNPAFQRNYNQWLLDNGMTPSDVASKRASRGGLETSLKKQETNRGMMGSFVRNMDKQIDRLDTIYDELKGRVDTKILNMPIRKIKMSVLGSAEESIITGYLTEIENEMAKLSTGSQASIAELSVEAQKKWDKIHDKNLSIKDIKQVLSETKHMASMRVESADEELDETRKKLSELGGGTKTEEKPKEDKPRKSKKPELVF